MFEKMDKSKKHVKTKYPRKNQEPTKPVESQKPKFVDVPKLEIDTNKYSPDYIGAPILEKRLPDITHEMHEEFEKFVSDFDKVIIENDEYERLMNSATKRWENKPSRPSSSKVEDDNWQEIVD